jgi:hypothetical protein
MHDHQRRSPAYDHVIDQHAFGVDKALFHGIDALWARARGGHGLRLVQLGLTRRRKRKHEQETAERSEEALFHGAEL